MSGPRTQKNETKLLLYIAFICSVIAVSVQRFEYREDPGVARDRVHRYLIVVATRIRQDAVGGVGNVLRICAGRPT